MEAVDAGKAAVQIMGDWERGEYAAKGEVGGKDFGCIAGFDADHPTMTTDGDVFVFPKQTDADKEAAQKRLANLIVSPAVQLAFNNAKGSTPIRDDVISRVPIRACSRPWTAEEPSGRRGDGSQPLAVE